MPKYIDRDVLCEFARHNSTIGIDANDIMRFPTADVVEVVRCKDCIHFLNFQKVRQVILSVKNTQLFINFFKKMKIGFVQTEKGDVRNDTKVSLER